MSTSKNANVDKFVEGADKWSDEIVKLRAVLLKTKLEETFKWNQPCYSFNGANIVIIQAFKSCLGIMFFKGKIMKDPKGLLVENGPNSQAARRLEFHSVEEIVKLTPVIKSYIEEAIEIENSGVKIQFKAKPASIPPELKKMFTTNAKFKKAFKELTPGRQRAYILFFSSAKQSATRQSRIEKYLPKILKGKGIND